jgi:protein SCO1/2
LPVTIAALAAVAVLAVPAPAGANPTGMPAVGQPAADQPLDPNVGIEQRLGAQVNLGLEFRDESERPVTLREAMNGKVTILVPVYFRCPMLCTRVLNGVLDGVRSFPQGFDAGNQFTVVAVSMDPKEHADLGHKKKAAYVGEYGRPGADAGWRFLTGKEESVRGLLTAVGYRYEYDKAFKEYNHPSGVVVLTPDGVVSRYFLGIGYDDGSVLPSGAPVPPAPTWRTLELSLVEASGGKVGSLADRFLVMVCYRFNGQGYSWSILRVVQAASVLTILVVGTVVFVAFRRDRRRAAAATATETAGPPAGVTP